MRTYSPRLAGSGSGNSRGIVSRRDRPDVNSSLSAAGHMVAVLMPCRCFYIGSILKPLQGGRNEPRHARWDWQPNKVSCGVVLGRLVFAAVD